MFNLSKDLNVKCKYLAIASHDNDYRLSWALNNALKISLTKVESVEVIDSKTQVVKLFSQYFFLNDTSSLFYSLISNRAENGFLLEKLTNIDYIFKLELDPNNNEIIDIIRSIKNIETVITAFELDSKQLKYLSKKGI